MAQLRCLYVFFKNALEYDFLCTDRYAEGYGVSMKGIDFAIKINIIIITLDCELKLMLLFKSTKSWY